MSNSGRIRQEIESAEFADRLKEIYIDDSRIERERGRYLEALKCFEDSFSGDEIHIYSAPGRSEVGGNHTDHQKGKVLAASINNDAIAVACKADGVISVISDGQPLISFDVNDIEKKESEEGTTDALIKGVVRGFMDRDYKVGGFKCYMTSEVLIGAGLSSSAAFETAIGTILSYLYNEGKVSDVEIAMIGQFAENVYFGKPCGLMDQMACSVGNLVYIDFADIEKPVIEKVDIDLAAAGYALCITDTKGSHADLTPDYAAIPVEMKSVARYFGKEVLREVPEEEFFKAIPALREKLSDRAVLRAIHFFRENERVTEEVEDLKNNDIDGFMKTVRKSGNSSYKYLQNVYTNRDVDHQNVSVALAMSEDYLGERGASRVHGGGFAGTIQAFVPSDMVEGYKKLMDGIFGDGACSVLFIRSFGGIKVL